ncbi:MAG: aldo/keto reductase [Erysipelotrichaceae bacterium]|nr:aldo/keto reductase [Erysipelotrichaceae bacterium]
MKKIRLGKSGLMVPPIAVGCMRLNALSENELAEYIRFCVDQGLNFFDHADIYGGGECEELFGRAFKKTGLNREDVFLQSKCAIVPGKMYDFSKDYILKSVDGILKRLDTDYLDVLILHRPDALMEPEEVGEAFDELEKSGKVRHFGVSNFRPNQISLLQKYVKQPLLADQLQFSIVNSWMISQGFEANMPTEGALDRDGGILEYLRLHDMTMQAWSPFQYGDWEGAFIGNEKFKPLNAALDEMAEKYHLTPTGVAAAWIFRHPANIQLIAGTTKISRMKEIIAAADVRISREDWYRLYLEAGHRLP